MALEGLKLTSEDFTYDAYKKNCGLWKTSALTVQHAVNLRVLVMSLRGVITV